MEPLKILVNTTRMAFGRLVKEALPKPSFEVVVTEPGQSFLEEAGRTYPDIAIVDYADGRDSTADLEADFLRAIRPEIRVVPVGRIPSLTDLNDTTLLLADFLRPASGRLATCA